MEEILKFLQDAKVFYLATAEGDQPRVRPMGFVMVYKNRLYFCTNNTKKMYQQMKANPKVEFCASGEGGKWLRICGKIAFDNERESKEKALESSPNLQRMYKADDGIFTLFYLENGEATITGMGPGAETKKFTL
jgi:uncharacterized pyridoxamine 5'-phosphate oxidase family protein